MFEDEAGVTDTKIAQLLDRNRIDELEASALKITQGSFRGILTGFRIEDWAAGGFTACPAADIYYDRAARRGATPDSPMPSFFVNEIEKEICTAGQCEPHHL